MRMYDLIVKKRSGASLTAEEIRFMIDGYTRGDIPDYQMSAFAMAVCFVGMSNEELAALTMAMVDSGERLDLTRFGTKSVDKHSTGGVGDKTSLIVAPLVASLGGIVAKMSGRGLGHTGGTVDKLESFPGFCTTLSAASFLKQVESIGVAIIGQSGNLTPADKKLYALRDVTGTVESLPLIASSIMSKKIAAGAHSIVLDVKVGSGAFNPTYEAAEKLAKAMVGLGQDCGRNVSAVITDMDRPLGFAIGNILEVKEAIRLLRGESIPDLKEVCLTLASEMLSLSLDYPREESRQMAEAALSDGRAFKRFHDWIAAQGGNPKWADDPELFPRPTAEYTLLADKDGFISRMDSEMIGRTAVVLGAGRSKKDEPIDLTAGILLCKKTGDEIKKGQPLATLYTSDPARLDAAKRLFYESLSITDTKPTLPPTVYGIIRKR